jgi:hypothetical protein
VHTQSDHHPERKCLSLQGLVLVFLIVVEDNFRTFSPCRIRLYWTLLSLSEPGIEYLNPQGDGQNISRRWAETTVLMERDILKRFWTRNRHLLRHRIRICFEAI